MADSRQKIVKGRAFATADSGPVRPRVVFRLVLTARLPGPVDGIGRLRQPRGDKFIGEIVGQVLNRLRNLERMPPTGGELGKFFGQAERSCLIIPRLRTAGMMATWGWAKSFSR